MTDPRILSFCESVCASGRGRWHLRWTTHADLKFGGGITEIPLCGYKHLIRGWDLEVAITAHHLEHNTCPSCLAELSQRR